MKSETKYFFALLIILLPNLSRGQIKKQQYIFTKTVEETITEIEKIRRNIHENITFAYKPVRHTIQKKVILERTQTSIDTFEIFYPGEKILMDLLLCQFSEILDDVTENKDFHNEAYVLDQNYKFSFIQYEQEDTLSEYLLDEVMRFQTTIRDSIDKLVISDDQKDFLKLYLKSILSYKDINNFNPDSIKTSSSQYLFEHPESEYRQYVREVIYPVYHTSKIGIRAAALAGLSVPESPLGDYFSAHPHVGLDLNLTWKIIDLKFKFSAGFMGKTKQEFDHREVWPKNNSVNTFFGGIFLGASLYNGNKLKIKPYAGVSTYDISTTLNPNQHQDEKVVNLTHFPCPGAGIDFIWKIRNYYSKDSYAARFKAEHESQYWYVFLSPGFNNPLFEKKDKRFKGFQYMLNIGVGLKANPAVRKKNK